MSSRRGAVERRCGSTATLRPGLAFMTPHFHDQVATNILTIDATDPKSGTAEFKATAIRVEKLPVADQEAVPAGVTAAAGNGDGDGATATNGDRRPVRESV